MAQKPSIPKGTRDFSPMEMMRRQYIFDTVKQVFRTYGFAPLETPGRKKDRKRAGFYFDISISRKICAKNNDLVIYRGIFR